jgi:hypothetical protein
MIRERNASALEPWLKEATESGVAISADFCHRDQAGPGRHPGCSHLLLEGSGKSKGRFIDSSSSNANPMVVLDLTCYDIACLLDLHELFARKMTQILTKGSTLEHRVFGADL